jgi:hypothetical protein
VRGGGRVADDGLGVAQVGRNAQHLRAVDHLESISTKYEFSATDIEPLVQTCMTTLSSKM